MVAVPVNAKVSEERLLPLQEVSASIKAEGAFAYVDLNLTYVNPSKEHPIEAIYEFPMESHMILAKLVAEIDGRKVEA